MAKLRPADAGSRIPLSRKPVTPRQISIALCRGTVAFVWLYQGLVPKLLGPSADELAMAMAVFNAPEIAMKMSRLAGVFEIAFSVCVVLFWRRAWPLWMTLMAMLGLLAFVAIFMPQLLTGAFNPVTTNLSVAALAAVALQLQREPIDKNG
ncbi:MAG: DoxX-like family protein [Burkholderiales bacterium]